MRYSPRVPQSFVEGVIFVLLLIPVAIVFLIKWIVIGIIAICMSAKQSRANRTGRGEYCSTSD